LALAVLQGREDALAAHEGGLLVLPEIPSVEAVEPKAEGERGEAQEYERGEPWGRCGARCRGYLQGVSAEGSLRR
jgi:hypothetical protein